MKTVVRNAWISLLEAAPAEPATLGSFRDQAVEIHRMDPTAIIGIDGHTGLWDELVEVRWVGEHQDQVRGAGSVVIRDQAGRLVESLPVDRSRPPREVDGETVFFLTDAE
jgi:hypothetical protein